MTTRRPLLPLPFVLWLVAFYGTWLAFVVSQSLWGLVAANWPMALAMGFGSYFAGSTPMGGGTVGFPVLVLLFDKPATLGRDFSLAVQAIGMTSASIYIITSGQKVDWRMLRPAIGVGAVTTPLCLLFVVDHLPATVLLLSFASLWAAFGVMMLMKTRSIAETDGIHPQSARHDRLVGAGVGLTGGVLVAMTGVGIDMLIFVAMTIFSRASLRISIPTSVVLMASMSIVGVLTRFVSGTWGPGVLDAWIAAAPVVAVGAPFGAFIVALLDRRITLYVVAVLCVGQYAWTCFAKQIPIHELVISVVGIVIFNYGAHRLYERYFPRSERRSDGARGGKRRRWGR